MERADHYSNWHGNFSVTLAKEDSRCRVDRLFSAVITMRKFDLSCASDRKATWKLINNMTSGFPASETARFPEDKFYIRESDCEWASMFTQLRSALVHLGKKHGLGEEVDAEVKLVQDLLLNFLRTLRNKYMVIDRAEFERKNKLTWEAPDDSSSGGKSIFDIL